MEKQPLHQRLAALREGARRREEGIRIRMEWVETRQRELWSRLDRQPEPSTPRVFEEPAPRPSLRPVKQIRQVQPARAREETRPYETRGPSLAPRPAEVLLAQFREILLEVASAVEADSAKDERPAATPQLVSTEP